MKFIQIQPVYVISKNQIKSTMPEKVDQVTSLTMNSSMLKKIAESELQESPKTRKRTLRELRDWLKNQAHISNVRTDNSFLLRFLRLKKFEMADSIKVLDKYLRMRTQNPNWFANLDIREAKLNDLISSGYCFVLPQRDSKGRRVVYSKASAMDANLYTACDVMRVHLLTFEALLEEEDVQVNGVTYVFDERDVNWSHISVWTPSEVSKVFSCCERALPLRHREVHFVGLPWTMSLVFQFAKSLLSQKLRDRFTTHANFDKLAEHVPASILPAEAGGRVPMSEMIDQWKAVLEERRQIVLNSDLVEYGLENLNESSTSNKSKVVTSPPTSKTKKPSSNNSEVIDVMSSVCKLEVSA